MEDPGCTMGSTGKDEPEDRRSPAYNLNIHYREGSDGVGANKFVKLLLNEIKIGNHKVLGQGRGCPQGRRKMSPDNMRKDEWRAKMSFVCIHTSDY